MGRGLLFQGVHSPIVWFTHVLGGGYILLNVCVSNAKILYTCRSFFWGNRIFAEFGDHPQKQKRWIAWWVWSMAWRNRQFKSTKKTLFFQQIYEIWFPRRKKKTYMYTVHEQHSLSHSNYTLWPTFSPSIPTYLHVYTYMSFFIQTTRSWRVG